jgi:hypothetical protein
MDLKPEETARIKGSFVWSAGSADFARDILEDARRDQSQFKGLLNYWQKMTDGARAAVKVKMAALASPGAEAGLPFVVEPDALDVGAALMALVGEGTDRKGRKINLPGLKEAVREAFQIWVERGNSDEIGNLRPPVPKEKMLTAKERKALPKSVPVRYRPYPSLAFVAEAISAILPKAFPNRQALLIAVDTQLRDLRQSGEI